VLVLCKNENVSGFNTVRPGNEESLKSVDDRPFKLTISLEDKSRIVESSLLLPEHI
jgi:hypothetical protein